MKAGPEITRQIMENIPAWLQIAFYVAVSAACVLAAAAFLRRLARYRRARTPAAAACRGGSTGTRAAGIFRYLAFHQPLLRDRFAGVAHLCVIYGFLILFIGTCLVFLEHKTPLHFFHGRFYLVASLVIDLGGAVFVAGLALLIGRRYFSRSADRLLRSWWVACMAWLLLAVGLTGFLVEGARIAREMPDFERWSAVGYGVACILRASGVDGEWLPSLHRVLWVFHAVLCVVFFAALPWRFFSHSVYGAMSWVTRRAGPRARLSVADLGRGAPGTVTALDLGWTDLLQADACTTCGRCDEVCPATAAGKSLRPRDLVLGLRRAATSAAKSAARTSDAPSAALTAVVPEHVGEEAIWSCTTCGVCNEVCPVGVEVLEKIVELRRGRVEGGDVPESAEAVFESTAARFNPFDKPAGDRFAWAAGFDVPVAGEEEEIELLYWVGCGGSCDADGQTVTRSMIEILNHLGVNYRVLGKRERCTGDPARRLGEEGLFQELARENIRILQRHGVRRVLTHCPHCFNAFANEYPDLGADFEVEHHSQFLARMIDEGKLRSTGTQASTVTFHDPCYLGRGNGETSSPRQVLASVNGLELREMPRSGDGSFCCGAGGGSMWLDVPGESRIENLRAEEARETGAATVVTACPFCKTMLASAIATGSHTGEPRVKDLAELVVESGMVK